jgi:hypothetical protein
MESIGKGIACCGICIGGGIASAFAPQSAYLIMSACTGACFLIWVVG